MARALRHPSGPAEVVTIRLSPAARQRLDEIAAARSLSRAAAVEALLWKVAESSPGRSKPATPARPKAEPLPIDETCPHRNAEYLATGMWRCPDCRRISRDSKHTWITV
jgi:hypothetical protein